MSAARLSKTSRLDPLASLRAILRPWRLHFYLSIDSTNTEARRLRESGNLSAPAVLWAETQTAGRGRGGSQWVSPAGSLTATFVVPVNPAIEAHLIPLYAGLAVRNVVAATVPTGDSVTVKWPNDVYIAGRKVCGILCERLTQPAGNPVDLIGIGINVSSVPSDFASSISGRIATLAAEGARVTPHELLSQLATELHVRLLQTPLPWPLAAAEFRQHCHLTGRRLRVTVSPESLAVIGTCHGIDDDGFLRLDDRRIISGHVEIL